MCLYCHNNLRKISLKVFSPRGSEDPIRLPSGANRLNSDSSGGGRHIVVSVSLLFVPAPVMNVLMAGFS